MHNRGDVTLLEREDGRLAVLCELDGALDDTLFALEHRLTGVDAAAHLVTDTDSDDAFIRIEKAIAFQRGRSRV